MIKHLYTILVLAVFLAFPANAQEDLENKGSACEAGEYLSDSGCQKCPKGTSSTGTTEEEGNYIAITITECIPCEPGTYAAKTGSVFCTACRAGTYAEGTGSLQCELCPTGSYAATDRSASCTPCEEGLQCNHPGMTAPEKCDPGTYAKGTGNKECLSCPAGTYSEGGKSIEIDGQITIIGVTECTPCAAGTYAGGTKNASCAPCTRGFYASKEGSTSCNKCPKGHFADKKGMTVCTPCPPGEYQDHEKRSSCLKCPEGTYAPGFGNTECTPCPGGTYVAIDEKTGKGKVGATYCEFCPEGTFMDKKNGKTVCSPCPEGTYSDASGNTLCSDCPAGTYASGEGNVSCTKCKKGTFASSRKSARCTACPAGSFSLDGAIACTKCSAGTYQPYTGASKCYACMSEEKSVTGNEGNGEASNPAIGATSCGSCDIGQYPQGSSCQNCAQNCDICTNGKTCDRCSEGYILFKDGTCGVCKPGERYDAEGEKCVPCKAGTVSGGGTVTECRKCEEGTFASGEGNVSCTACEEGTYASGEGNAECLPCNFNGAKTGLYYADKKKSTQCSMCNTHCRICKSKTGECVRCDEAGYGINPKNTKECENCATKDGKENKYYSKDQRCQTCESIGCADQCQSTDGLCLDPGCNAEYGYRNGRCTYCENGKYSTGKKYSCYACLNCAENCDKKSGCTKCPAGYRYVPHDEGYVCQICGNDTFLTEEDNTPPNKPTECKSCTVGCEDGKCDKTIGCTLCKAGYVLSNGQCTMCNGVEGYYSTGGKQSVCNRCDRCKTCDNTNGSCTSCYEHYYLENGDCKWGYLIEYHDRLGKFFQEIVNDEPDISKLNAEKMGTKGTCREENEKVVCRCDFGSNFDEEYGNFLVLYFHDTKRCEEYSRKEGVPISGCQENKNCCRSSSLEPATDICGAYHLNGRCRFENKYCRAACNSCHPDACKKLKESACPSDCDGTGKCYDW